MNEETELKLKRLNSQIKNVEYDLKNSKLRESPAVRNKYALLLKQKEELEKEEQEDETKNIIRI